MILATSVALHFSYRQEKGINAQHLMLIFEFSPSILLTLGCGCTSGVGSGAFGVSSVSAASVPGGVGGGTRSLSQTGSQGRQGRQGCWHTLVVIHPRNTVNTIKNNNNNNNLSLTVVMLLVC